MSFFFEQLARSSGLGAPPRAAAPPAPVMETTLETVVEREAAPATPMPAREPSAAPPAAPRVEAPREASPPPAREIRVEHREVVRERLVERILEREGPPAPAPPAPATPAAPPPAAPAAARGEPSDPAQMLDRVLRWLSRQPEGGEAAAPGPPPPQAPPGPAEQTLIVNAAPPPAAEPPAPRIEASVEIPRHRESAPSTGAPAAPAAPGDAIREETVEISIGAVHVVVEAPPQPARPPEQRPSRRPVRALEAPAAPDSVRRYGLLPN